MRLLRTHVGCEMWEDGFNRVHRRCFHHHLDGLTLPDLHNSSEDSRVVIASLQGCHGHHLSTGNNAVEIRCGEFTESSFGEEYSLNSANLLNFSQTTLFLRALLTTWTYKPVQHVNVYKIFILRHSHYIFFNVALLHDILSRYKRKYKKVCTSKTLLYKLYIYMNLQRQTYIKSYSCQGQQM